jgi:hypothetical protein
MAHLHPVVTVRSPSSRYLDELVRLKSGPDMLARGFFPNAKEVSESFGAYNAARKHLRDIAPLGDPDITVAIVGDGNSPRTAATFAYRTAWRCLSIDPRMRDHWAGNNHGIARLQCVKARVEECASQAGKLVVVAVHSHADLTVACSALAGPDLLAVIAIPCCVKQEVGREPDIEYQDWGIWSPHRTVRIWK